MVRPTEEVEVDGAGACAGAVVELGLEAYWSGSVETRKVEKIPVEVSVDRLKVTRLMSNLATVAFQP
jgi:hypothetical protein